MSKLDTRPREATVYLVDMDKLQALCEQLFGESESRYNFLECAVYETSDRGVAVLNREGVGCWADEHGKVGFYLAWGGWVDIPVEYVAGLKSDETENLADFIRSFGDRLENNFDLWYSRRVQ